MKPLPVLSQNIPEELTAIAARDGERIEVLDAGRVWDEFGLTPLPSRLARPIELVARVPCVQ